MLKRLKLYFTSYNLSDAYYISVLHDHNLNPYADYDKSIHRISMLECILQIYEELAAKTNDNTFDNEIKCYQNDIAILKSKENPHE